MGNPEFLGYYEEYLTEHLSKYFRTAIKQDKKTGSIRKWRVRLLWL